MNDPEQTIGLPVVEFSGESNGTSPRWALHPKDATISPEDTISPPKNTNTSHPKIAADAQPSPSGPTVVEAVRRYRVMVLAVAILAMVAAIGYSLMQPKVYEAKATVTVPVPASSAADPGQYLDSQVVLLQSQGVAQQAAGIANRELGSGLVNASDFNSVGGSLVIVPPATVAPGGYGASIVTVAFKGPSAEIAQVGLNAVLQAFKNAVSNAIKAEANATIAGINYTITKSTSQAQAAALTTQRTGAIATEQSELAQQPAVAIEPATVTNHKLALDGGIGLVIGILIGAALAFALASRRHGSTGRSDPSFAAAEPLDGESHPLSQSPQRLSPRVVVPVYPRPERRACLGPARPCAE